MGKANCGDAALLISDGPRECAGQSKVRCSTLGEANIKALWGNTVVLVGPFKIAHQPRQWNRCVFLGIVECIIGRQEGCNVFFNPELCQILPIQHTMDHVQANSLEKKCMGYLIVHEGAIHLALYWNSNILMIHRCMSDLTRLFLHGCEVLNLMRTFHPF